MSPNPLWKENTTGLCPVCLTPASSVLEQQPDNTIWLTQTCRVHGKSRAIVSSNASEYLRFRTHLSDRVTGCCCGPGDSCSPDSGPPTCVLLLEITQACNLRCPTCYADAQGHDFMSIETARERLDTFFKQQGTLDMLMISGGEPTIHPRFDEILDLALSYPINRILINTNGIRLTQKPELVQKISAHRNRVELYVSFASFRPEVHHRLYGKDLVETKRRAMEIARDAGIFMTLVPTVERGVNEDEIGDLYRYALSMENINGITFQPVMDNGRYENQYNPLQRLTLTDVLEMLEKQTEGALKTSDFVGLPCSHPDCCVLTFGFLDSRREVITPLPRHLDVARYLDLFSDRITFEGILGGAVRRVWSDLTSLRSAQSLRELGMLFARGGVRDALPLLNKPEEIGKRIFRVAVKPFMDAQTYDQKRIDQCCTKILNERGEAVSFCEYNVFHRGRKPEPSSKARILTMAG